MGFSMKKILVFVLALSLVLVVGCQKAGSGAGDVVYSGKISGEEFSELYRKIIPCVFSGPSFTENQVVPIDELLAKVQYFDISNHDTYEILDIWKEYQTSDHTITVPKKVVKKFLESKYAVKIDDSKSEYAQGDFLVLEDWAGFEPSIVDISSFSIDGNRISIRGNIHEIRTALAESNDNTEDEYISLFATNRYYEICIENFLSEDYKYISYNEETYEL